jgi:hypothetical protein
MLLPLGVFTDTRGLAVREEVSGRVANADAEAGGVFTATRCLTVLEDIDGRVADADVAEAEAEGVAADGLAADGPAAVGAAAKGSNAVDVAVAAAVALGVFTATRGLRVEDGSKTNVRVRIGSRPTSAAAGQTG